MDFFPPPHMEELGGVASLLVEWKTARATGKQLFRDLCNATLSRTYAMAPAKEWGALAGTGAPFAMRMKLEAQLLELKLAMKDNVEDLEKISVGLQAAADALALLPTGSDGDLAELELEGGYTVEDAATLLLRVAKMYARDVVSHSRFVHQVVLIHLPRTHSTNFDVQEALAAMVNDVCATVEMQDGSALRERFTVYGSVWTLCPHEDETVVATLKKLVEAITSRELNLGVGLTQLF